jgi:hypothetical protein
MKNCFFIFLTLAVLTTACNSDFINITEANKTVQAYQKFEVTFELPKTYKNPFDFNEIEVSAIFTNPAGETVEVPGFWYEDFIVDETSQTVTATGDTKWMIRFTPQIAGNWSYVLQAEDSAGTRLSKKYNFDVVMADERLPGFIRIHPKNRQYFHYDNSGEHFFAAGLNSDINFINKSSAADPDNKNWGTNSGYHPQWPGSPTKGLEYSARNYLKAAEIVGTYDNELHLKAEQILKAGLERFFCHGFARMERKRRLV